MRSFLQHHVNLLYNKTFYAVSAFGMPHKVYFPNAHAVALHKCMCTYEVHSYTVCTNKFIDIQVEYRYVYVHTVPFPVAFIVVKFPHSSSPTSVILDVSIAVRQ